MAMGSSMPEIFLNIIEIMFNKFETGALGPGTILEKKWHDQNIGRPLAKWYNLLKSLINN